MVEDWIPGAAHGDSLFARGTTPGNLPTNLAPIVAFAMTPQIDPGPESMVHHGMPHGPARFPDRAAPRPIPPQPPATAPPWTHRQSDPVVPTHYADVKKAVGLSALFETSRKPISKLVPTSFSPAAGLPIRSSSTATIASHGSSPFARPASRQLSSSTHVPAPTTWSNLSSPKPPSVATPSLVSDTSSTVSPGPPPVTPLELPRPQPQSPSSPLPRSKFELEAVEVNHRAELPATYMPHPPIDPCAVQQQQPEIPEIDSFPRAFAEAYELETREISPPAPPPKAEVSAGWGSSRPWSLLDPSVGQPAAAVHQQSPAITSNQTGAAPQGPATTTLPQQNWYPRPSYLESDLDYVSRT